MKHDCEIVRDLMPMCIDGTASDKTKQMVEEHVEECPPCSGVYAEMKGAEKLTLPVQSASPEFATTVKKMKSRRKRRTWLTLLLGVVLAMGVFLAGYLGYCWYFVQEVMITPESLSFERSIDGIAMVKATGIPRGAEMKMLVRQHDRNGDGMPNYEMYLYLTATRAEMKNSGPTDCNFIFGTIKAGKIYISNEGAAPVELEQIIHGTLQQGGEIIWVGSGDLRTVASHGLTIKLPEIFWSGSAASYLQQDSTLVFSFITPTPQPPQNP